MFCNKCGIELPEGSGFCNKCGASQGAAAAAPDPAAPISGGAKPADGQPPKEEDVWKGGYSPRAMGMAFVGAGIWFVGMWIAYFMLTGKGTWFEGKSWVVWVFATLSPLPLLYAVAVALWRRLTLHYRLTTQRLFVQVGLIGRRIEEVELIRVDDVTTSQGVIERMFDVGTVKISSSDVTTPTMLLLGLKSPVAIKEKLRAQVQERRKRIVNLNQV
ncbi:MAG: membrane-flanked domain-containing [Planctomycetota bacterium]|nr:MAG: membrane-flanked domain-containing [Planctomycetota bacterium]